MEKVLVVDDNIINLKMASKILEEVCKPILVPSGEKALKFLSMNRPALILLDILMPEMDGFATLAKIKENPATADIPVLFLTADNEEATMQRGLEAGVLGFIKKPVTKASMMEAISPYLPM